MFRYPLLLTGFVLAWQASPDADPRTTRLTKEDPLRAALQIAYDGQKRMQETIRDYTCILTRRERVDGRQIGYGDDVCQGPPSFHEKRRDASSSRSASTCDS